MWVLGVGALWVWVWVEFHQQSYKGLHLSDAVCTRWPDTVSQSEVLGRFYNPNTTPKDKERVVVCLHGTGQELH